MLLNMDRSSRFRLIRIHLLPVGDETDEEVPSGFGIDQSPVG